MLKKFASGLFMTILFVSQSVHSQGMTEMSDWIFVGQENKNRGFYSPSSVRRHGTIVSVRTVINVHDWKELEDVPFKSIVADFAIDCKNWRFVVEDKLLYSDNLGRGALIRKDTFDPKNFSEKDIVPIDRAHMLHKVAAKVCKK